MPLRVRCPACLGRGAVGNGAENPIIFLNLFSRWARTDLLQQSQKLVSKFFVSPDDGHDSPVGSEIGGGTGSGIQWVGNHFVTSPESFCEGGMRATQPSARNQPNRASGL